MTLTTASSSQIRAVSTVRSAVRDPFNLFMLVPGSLLAIFSLAKIVLLGREPLDLMILVVSSGFVFFYFRAVTNRELEISSHGVFYREASTRLFFPWEEIESVRMEPRKKQITIWYKGKFRRIHEFGLPTDDLQLVRRALQDAIASRAIPLR